MTISDLAVMVKKGFDEVHGKFEKVDQRFDGVDDKFSKVDNNFKFVRVELASLRVDVTEIKGTLRPLVRSVATMEDGLSDLRIRVGVLEQRVGVEN